MAHSVTKVLPWLCGALLSGCVTVYQPVSALQRPVVIDPTVANFEGVKMLVRCLPGDAADQGESEELCQNLSTLYGNQGATVEVEVPEAGAGTSAANERTGRPDLIIELSARQVHEENSAWLWLLCYASATLIPAITEATFAQDIAIRDADGFMLVNDSLQARFIRYFGVGYWAVNGLIDLILRPKGEELGGNAHKRDFSRDFHGQMSQLAFHAVMRSKILKSFEPDSEPAPAAPRPTPTPGPAQRSPAPAAPAPPAARPQRPPAPAPESNDGFTPLPPPPPISP